MHDLEDLRAEAERCKRAIDETSDKSLKERFAARGLEFAQLAEALGKKAKRKSA
jgi:hypothetical protein